MRKRIICSAIILAALCPVIVNADTGDIKIDGERTYKAVRLTPPVYNRSNRDLSDILILDGEGSPEPYFIHSFETAKTETAAEKHVLDFVNDFVKDGDSYADYYIEADEQRDIVATSVSVRANAAMFAKSVELRGSYDGVVWDFIQQDKLYRVDENEKLTITFEKPQKYTYYRFKILDNAEQIAFDSVYLEYSRNIVEQVFFTETIEPEFEIEEKDKATHIKLHGLRNVKIGKVTIYTDDTFKRPVYFADGRSKTLYNLSFGGNLYQDTALDFNSYSESSNILEIRIGNGDDKPVNINRITLDYFADEVIFKGQNGTRYTLSFGGAIENAPVYDIANYKDLILNEGYDLLSIENMLIQTEAAAEEPQKPDYSMVFNIVVTAVAVLLGIVILLRLRPANKQ